MLPTNAVEASGEEVSTEAVEVEDLLTAETPKTARKTTKERIKARPEVEVEVRATDSDPDTFVVVDPEILPSLSSAETRTKERI